MDVTRAGKRTGRDRKMGLENKHRSRASYSAHQGVFFFWRQCSPWFGEAVLHSPTTAGARVG